MSIFSAVLIITGVVRALGTGNLLFGYRTAKKKQTMR